MRYFYWIILLSWSTICLTAQSTAEIVNKFIDYSLESDTLNIRARLFIPETYDDQEEYPVVITLHGLGECGDDNLIHIQYNHLATTWGKDDFQAVHPCFIFSPQCPAGSNWTTTDVYQSVMVLLDSLRSSYSIDENRLYITGLSLGGIGTWNYLRYDPELYAAAVPVCGGLYMSDNALKSHVNIIRHTPLWNFHGNLDNVVNTNESRNIISQYPEFMEYPLFTHRYYRADYRLEEDVIDEYIARHTELIYSEIPDVGHNVWNYAYQMPQMKEWMFRQRKHAADHVIVEKQYIVSGVTGTHEFFFSTSGGTDSVTIWAGHMNSPDWEYLDGIDASSGTYLLDSERLSDHPRTLLKFIAHDTAGHAIGRGYSDMLRIDNEGNGSPCIELVDDLFLENDKNSLERYKMAVWVADPESDPLHASFYVSYDNGKHFEAYDDRDLDEGIYEQSIFFYQLYVSDSMVLRAEVTDGVETASAQTLYFRNLRGRGVSSRSLPADDFEIFPNPVHDLVNIVSPVPGPCSIEISSLHGQVIYADREDGYNHRFDLSTLGEGIYIMKVRSGDMVRLRKILKLAP
jgi:predicted esterase